MTDYRCDFMYIHIMSTFVSSSKVRKQIVEEVLEVKINHLSNVRSLLLESVLLIPCGHSGGKPGGNFLSIASSKILYCFGTNSDAAHVAGGMSSL